MLASVRMSAKNCNGLFAHMRWRAQARAKETKKNLNPLCVLEIGTTLNNISIFISEILILNIDSLLFFESVPARLVRDSVSVELHASRAHVHKLCYLLFFSISFYLLFINII